MVRPNQPPTLRVASDIRDPQGLAFFSVGSSAISPARFRSQRHRACVTRVSFTTRETGWRRPARFPACSGQSSDHPSPPPAAGQAPCGAGGRGPRTETCGVRAGRLSQPRGGVSRVLRVPLMLRSPGEMLLPGAGP